MKASSRASATMAANMALRTNAAGPSLHNFSKMEAIAEPKAGVGASLRAFLIGGVSSEVLARRHLQAQTAAVGLRGEAADLVDLRKVFGARGEEQMAGEPRLVTAGKREREARGARGLP